ncbi:histidine kinase dimerization/phospho-acceptor domain-containing protein [Sphingosinicella sp. LHD-64]|uniref:sensor histidine kinase n=1 Tax=Sphingosinicella sp. LHD-64 TaxID=3072139 RepID=UPI00280DC8CF|nr:histidine kinase dimerization/phospho-acceptor domain-containing protein [Sphingosinicella sp. LHD-64]MDQ8757760.1 histidine kinase dimerization/phospho-acceptor domain-containing protein [Sphingosinicella sp. LHD-64]
MRFDDRIATVLARPADHRDRATAQWRQLVDLLAQHRGEESEEVGRAYAFLEARRSAIEPATRRRIAAALAGRAVAPGLVEFFAADSPPIAAPLIAGARLEADQWLALLPRLGPSARALLRHRRDLPPSVTQALAAFGRSDFVLEGAVAEAPVAVPPAPERSESQIRELVERIEAYRRHKEEERPTAAFSPPPPDPDEPIDAFRWETASDGTICWVDSPARGPLVGQTIAAIAAPGHYGVDGQAAGAFEKRAPFRDARFRVPGEGASGGDWRISGVPYFDPHRGGFLGYRGTARRPRVDETARTAGASGVFGTEFPADSLRQLIHELRTPLNAIIGFSEMIEGQYLGPAASGYRARAGDMIGQARRLLSAVDDLDTAARIESRRLELDDSAVDAVALLCRLHESYERVAADRGARLSLDIALDLPLARVAPAAAERMIARLLAATIGLAEEGETIAATMATAGAADRPMLRLSLDRPRAIAGAGEAALLDPGYSPEGDWPAAPVLGLGFALRLVRNLAQAVGGELLIGSARIALDLPALAEAEAFAGQSESGS